MPNANSKKAITTIIGNKAKYYVLGCSTAPSTTITGSIEIPGSLMDPEPLTAFQKEWVKKKSPFKLSLNKLYKGNVKPFYPGTYLMRDDLAQAIMDAGGKNIELFPVSVFNPWKKAIYKNYKLFHITGAVDCVKKPESKKVKKVSANFGPGAEVDFYEGLYINEKKADVSGLEIFRIKKTLSAIVVSEKIRLKIEEKCIPYMVFYGPGQWSG